MNTTMSSMTDNIVVDINNYKNKIEMYKFEMMIAKKKINDLNKKLYDAVPVKLIQNAFNKMQAKYSRISQGYIRDMTYYDIFIGNYSSSNIVLKLSYGTGIPIEVVSRISKKYKCNIKVYHKLINSSGYGISEGEIEYPITAIFHKNVTKKIDKKRKIIRNHIDNLKTEIDSKCLVMDNTICTYYAINSSGIETEICKTTKLLDDATTYSICDKYGFDIKIVYAMTDNSQEKTVIYKFTGNDEL